MNQISAKLPTVHYCYWDLHFFKANFWPSINENVWRRRISTFVNFLLWNQTNKSQPKKNGYFGNFAWTSFAYFCRFERRHFPWTDDFDFRNCCAQNPCKFEQIKKNFHCSLFPYWFHVIPLSQLNDCILENSWIFNISCKIT